MEDEQQQPTELTEPAAHSNGTAPVQTSPPTRADVARLANVSGATVSYVLNDVQGARVSEATKERVRQAAAQIGYVPDQMASSLRSRRNDLVLLPFFDWPYNVSSINFLQELARQLDQRGYAVMLRFFGQRAKEDLAHRIAAFHPAGVIVMSEELSQVDIELLSRNGVRAVLVYGAPAADSESSIPVDFTPAGELIGQHFLKNGHRSVAGIVPKDPRIISVGMQRFEGVQHAFDQHGLAVKRVDMDYDTREAAELADRWKRGPRPAAVFAYNDEYAFLLMSALQDAGLQVPGDIALAGCDDLPLCQLTRPRLTSVRAGSPETTRALVSYFDALMQGQAPVEKPDLGLSFELVVRDSG